MLRRITSRLLPSGVVEAPKRPLQTPQREWLRGPLREWADSQIERGLAVHSGSWINHDAVRKEWRNFCDGQGDNSFFVWQWVSIGLMSRKQTAAAA
jgi:asparagine synthase (glutamine-hydrolysing)